MAQESSPSRSEEQRREELNFSLEAMGSELFPENPLIIRGIFELKPSPLKPSCSPLIIMRANEDSSAQGCYLDLKTPAIKQEKKIGDTIKGVSEELCKSRNCSPKVIRGVVVFLGLEVNLVDMGNNLREMIEQLSPGTSLWFVEPPSYVISEQLEREIKREKVKFLRKTLGLACPRSIRTDKGSCYSVGRVPMRRKESITPTQPQLELVSQE